MTIADRSQEWYLAHRVDLHGDLKKHALEFATLHTGCRIAEIHIDTPRPRVRLEDGRTFEADLLLGADGLHVWSIDSLYGLTLTSPRSIHLQTACCLLLTTKYIVN